MFLPRYIYTAGNYPVDHLGELKRRLVNCEQIPMKITRIGYMNEREK